MTSTPRQTAADLIARLGLRPLEGEGAWWASGPRTRNLSSITLLLTAGDDGFSAMHRLNVDEGWQWIDGDPAAMLRLGNGRGALQSVQSGSAQILVTAGTWMGAATLGAWTLFTCWCSPAFTWEGFELADRAALQAEYTDYRREIEILTRVKLPSARLVTAGARAAGPS